LLNHLQVKNAFLSAGFKRIRGSAWNACWAKHPTPAGFQKMNRFQKVRDSVVIPQEIRSSSP
jgi:hypothetical protein